MSSQQTAAKGELVANSTEASAVGAVNWSPTETTVHLLTTYSYFYLGVGVWQQANLVANSTVAVAVPKRRHER